MMRGLKFKFARFGGLSSVNQRGYDSSMPTLHSPPARRGIYCFPWPFYEKFLLGKACTNAPYVPGAKFSYARDASGEIIDENHPRSSNMGNKYMSVPSKEWANYMERYPDFNDPEYDEKVEDIEQQWKMNHPGKSKWVYVKEPKPRIFSYGGDVWHHLGKHVSPGEVLQSKGEWTKTTASTHRGALKKWMHQRAQHAIRFALFSSSSIPNPRYCANHVGVKDELECFIEKI